MQKHTIFGLPLNPMPLLEELRGASFCISYATRQKLGKQLDQAIDLVGQDGILLVDNGAFSFWKNGTPAEHVLTDEYLDGWEAWAGDILARCPQAIAVIPDVIGGTEAQNDELIALTIGGALPFDRCMPVWHLDESLDRLERFVMDGWDYIALGSSGAYAAAKGPAWTDRIQEALDHIDRICAESDGAYVRPRIHMMRAQAQAHKFDFDSSDSTNVAVNHNRQARVSGEDLKAFATRVASQIEASCDMEESEHQAKRPLLFHLEVIAWHEEEKKAMTFDENGYPELPDFLNRKLNGYVPDQKIGTRRRTDTSGIVWPRKKNWRKIEAKRRERDRREGIVSTPIANRKGQ